MNHATMAVGNDNPNAAAGDAKGFINGWMDGETVDLRYTRLYFCAEPPESAVASNCEVGAAATITPRSGPIPKIYALAAAGFQPDPATLHCKGGTVCLNHPPMLDLSRLGLPASVASPPHSHICDGPSCRVAQHGEHSRDESRGLERDRRGEEPNEGAGAPGRGTTGPRHSDERLLLPRGTAGQARVEIAVGTVGSETAPGIAAMPGVCCLAHRNGC